MAESKLGVPYLRMKGKKVYLEKRYVSPSGRGAFTWELPKKKRPKNVYDFIEGMD